MECIDAGKEMLELVVDAPELEAIWAAFQVDEELAARARKTAAHQGEDEEN